MTCQIYLFTHISNQHKLTDVNIVGGEAVISGQSAAASSNKVDIVATDTAGATQADFKPVGDVNTASNAFSEVTSGTGTIIVSHLLTNNAVDYIILK